MIELCISCYSIRYIDFIALSTNASIIKCGNESFLNLENISHFIRLAFTTVSNRDRFCRLLRLAEFSVRAHTAQSTLACNSHSLRSRLRPAGKAAACI